MDKERHKMKLSGFTAFAGVSLIAVAITVAGKSATDSYKASQKAEARHKLLNEIRSCTTPELSAQFKSNNNRTIQIINDDGEPVDCNEYLKEHSQQRLIPTY